MYVCTYEVYKYVHIYACVYMTDSQRMCHCEHLELDVSRPERITPALFFPIYPIRIRIGKSLLDHIYCALFSCCQDIPDGCFQCLVLPR